MPDALEEKALCTCKCPDGPGQHLVGCHVYDTPLMQGLREQHHEVLNEVSELMFQIYRLLPGTSEENLEVTKDLKNSFEALCVVRAKIAIEDDQNLNGIHDERPWKGLDE